MLHPCRPPRRNQSSFVPPTITRLPPFPLFEGLSRGALSEIAAAPRRNVRAGELLWAAGADASGLLVVLRGTVRVVRAPDGRQYAVHTEGPGGTLGDVPFFAGGRYPATAIAEQAVECLVIDRARFARVVAQDPEFAMRCLERLARRVRTLVGRLDDRSSRTVSQRVAALLLERHAASAGGSFTLGATQAEVAEELGTVREVLVRTLRELREAGCIRAVARGRYVVVDAKGLKDRQGAGA